MTLVFLCDGVGEDECEKLDMSRRCAVFGDDVGIAVGMNAIVYETADVFGVLCLAASVGVERKVGRLW